MEPAKILVVEDEGIVALDLANQLKQLGHTVVGTIDRGEAVLDEVTASQPDLIVIDIRLKGDMDGIEAVRQIQVQFNLPIVFLTAYSDQETRERAEAITYHGLLIKPFAANDLYQMIEICLASENQRLEYCSFDEGDL